MAVLKKTEASYKKDEEVYKKAEKVLEKLKQELNQLNYHGKVVTSPKQQSLKNNNLALGSVITVLKR